MLLWLYRLFVKPSALLEDFRVFEVQEAPAYGRVLRSDVRKKKKSELEILSFMKSLKTSKR